MSCGEAIFVMQPRQDRCGDDSAPPWTTRPKPIRVEGLHLGRIVTVHRRTFVLEARKAFPIVVGAVYVIGCGSGSPTSPSAVAGVLSTSTVVNAHSHTVNVPASDQMHPVDMTYTSSSSLSHVHMVTLTASQLSTLAAGGAVTVTSTVSTVTGNHSHDVTFQGKKS